MLASDWRLTLPAGTPYDRQLLLHCIRRTVAHWGTVRVALGRRLLVVVGGAAEAERQCPRCGRRCGAMRCQLAGWETCIGCALEAASEGATEATVGVGAMAPAVRHALRQPHSGTYSARAAAKRASSTRRRQ